MNASPTRNLLTLCCFCQSDVGRVEDAGFGDDDTVVRDAGQLRERGVEADLERPQVAVEG